MNKRRVALTLTLLLLVACFSGGCGEEGAGETAVLRAADGTLQCKLPASWEDAAGTLNKVASLEAADSRAGRYMVAISELKDDFDEDLGLSGYSQIVTNNVTNMLKEAKTISAEEHEVNGSKAILTKIEGSLDGVKIRYWVCAVDFSLHYTQITAWTLAEKAKDSEAAILSVIDTVAETEQETGQETGSELGPESAQ